MTASRRESSGASYREDLPNLLRGCLKVKRPLDANAVDLLTLAKAITGGRAGMGATVATERVARAAEGKVNVYSTYGWHPLSVEAALANLAYLRAHQTHLLKNVAERSEDFRSRLHQMDFGFPALTISRRTVHEGLDILERCL